MRPLRVAVLTSSSAPGIEQLLAGSDRGVLYDLACVAGSEESFAQRRAVEEANVPLVLRPLKAILAGRGMSFRNLASREEYDRETADVLRAYGADYAILAGYRYFVSGPLLEGFADHLLAIHDADLTVLDDEGARRYCDLHGVRRAIFAGAAETRSSVFFVTERPGAGPLMLLSRPFPVAPIAHDALACGEYDLAVAYARVHRQWMTTTSWGGMLVEAIRLLAGGTIAIADGIAWIDGAPGPCRLGEAPRFCEPEQIRRGIPASCPFIQS